LSFLFLFLYPVPLSCLKPTCSYISNATSQWGRLHYSTWPPAVSLPFLYLFFVLRDILLFSQTPPLLFDYLPSSPQTSPPHLSTPLQRLQVLGLRGHLNPFFAFSTTVFRNFPVWLRNGTRKTPPSPARGPRCDMLPPPCAFFGLSYLFPRVAMNLNYVSL